MDFNEVLQKAIDKQRAENDIVKPEYVFIHDAPFYKTEYTQLRESKYLMDNFDAVANLKCSGLKIADELLPRSINGYVVRYVLELTSSEFVYQSIIYMHVCVSLFCNGTGKPTTFYERHAFDLSNAKRSDGSNNESFYNYVNTGCRDIFEHLLHSVCRFANAQYEEQFSI
jgi:hypothetical protein